MDDRIRGFAQKIWNYHYVDHQLAHADAILVLCSHDTAVARRRAVRRLPDDVWNAYEELVKAGYDRHLLSS